MKLVKSALAMLLTAAVTYQAHATEPAPAIDYPTKAVRVLVGFPPGQTTDVIARKLAQRLTTNLGQSFFVDNKPGVGAGLAAEEVAKANPDGYTILATSSGPIAVNKWIYKNLRYDAAKDLEPIAFLGMFPLVMFTNTSSKFNTLEELTTYAKENPGKVTYASGGNGVTNHLVMEMFKKRADIDLLHIPYRGGVAGMTDVIGGQVDVMFEVVSIAEPLVKQGRLKPLAVASENRVLTLPDVPTISESGYAGFRGDPWIGVVAPKNIPKDVQKKLFDEIKKIVESPSWQEESAALGAVTQLKGPAEFGEFIESETARWGEAAKQANVTIN